MKNKSLDQNIQVPNDKFQINNHIERLQLETRVKFFTPKINCYIQVVSFVWYSLLQVMQEKYFVFTGRPNAGKSSLVKKLTGLNITTGKRAGTTRKVSYYPLSDDLVLVDLPGLGKMVGVSKKFEEKVNMQIINFLESNTGAVKKKWDIY